MAKGMLRDIGVIPTKGKYLVVDQTRGEDAPAFSAFFDTYTEACEVAENRAKARGAKVEVWTTLRVIPDAHEEETK